jgi:cation diffusion facilitator CzcD-associated flavoprotein CzcO
VYGPLVATNDPLPGTQTVRGFAVRAPRVLVVGAGFGGIGLAATLVRSGVCTADEIVVLDRGDQLGGVWRDNRYPGCACDIPAPLYSYSFAQNPQWSSRFPGHEEIRGYLESCVDRFGLRDSLRLGHEVTSARWDDDAAVWRVSARRLADGTTHELVADVFVPAVGQLSRPHVPLIAGVESFTGPVFHSAHWPQDLDVTGKRVGIIGTGASAIQIVPAIAGTAAHVTVFQRTPPWTLPKPTRRYTAAGSALNRRMPALMRLPRLGFWGLTVATGLAVTGNPVAGAVMRALSNAQRRLQVRDATLRAAVTPDYPMGCKRVLFTNDWFPTLARPDVDLQTSAIAGVEPTGVRTRDGVLHEVDVLVYGTGFEAAELLVPLQVSGRAASPSEPAPLLHDEWKHGAHAYLGITVPDFPNLFIVYGPNTNTGNTSVVFFIEAQSRYIAQALTLLARRRALDPSATLAVRAEVEQRYDAEIQRRLADSVWVACDNWYRSAEGRVVTNWPGMAAEYEKATARLDAGDFVGA